jgi:hypothetical protein
MALFALQPGLLPLGQFDVLDTDLASVTGGEVMALTSASTSLSTTEKAAADALDGYLYDASGTIANRPASRLALAADINGMLALADDGLAGYGTMFGQTIGSPVGLAVTGTNLGPHSAAASGKVTLWEKPGLYEVTVTSLASDFVSTIGSVGLNPGATLGFNASSKLSHAACSGAVASSGVATFVEFSSSGSLVTTPAKLVGTTTLSVLYPRVVVAFHAGHGERAL